MDFAEALLGHREVALAIRGVLLEQFPALAEVLP